MFDSTEHEISTLIPTKMPKNKRVFLLSKSQMLSIQLSMKLKLLIKGKMFKIQIFLAFKLSYVVFIKHIIVKMPTAVDIFACGALAASICVGIVIPSTWLSIYITYC